MNGLAIDSFAGGGGASTGIELAGLRVDIAINHDPAAIAMHRANHPHTKHYCENVWNVDPREACGNRHVALAWFSPDCKHFSKAKGGALVDRRIRGLAWIVLKWAAAVKPDVILLENVEEFVTWGPVRKGKPVKRLAGSTFHQWESQLAALRYEIEHRELVACDYGAPTSRKRFYLIARCDGKPIVWPEPTHGRPGTLETISGIKKPWRTAAEIIDWTLPAPSIFSTKAEIKARYGVNAVRPLRPNTLKRIARGVDKFTVKSGEPFIVSTNHTSSLTDYDFFRGGSIDAPLGVMTAKNGRGIAAPTLIQYHGENPFIVPIGDGAVQAPYMLTNTSNAVGTRMDAPVNTCRTGGGCGQMMVAPSIIQYHSEQSEKVRGQNMYEPIMTVDASNRYGITAAHLSEWYGNARDGLSMREPLRTLTARDREALTLAHVMKYKGQDLGQPAPTPLHTLTATAGEFGMVHTRVEKYAPGADMKRWPEVREMLNEYCGYKLADNEVLLLKLLGAEYFIADIGLRMLTPREAFNAQGFPGDYIIDVDDTGRAYPKKEQMARCGNAVCPPVACALVRANVTETMKGADYGEGVY